jgi:NAD(P)-dependent dehydrogenase (short-subunit alcohol dehydrogenase family)
VLITGAGSGLGREMALTFTREGAKIGVNDVRPEAAQNVLTEVERAGGRAVRLVADVSDSAGVKLMFAEFLAAFGTIDILVNNAGIASSRPRGEVAVATTDKTDDDWRKMLATHLDATFYCTREALRTMIAKKSGRIINLGSIAGHHRAGVRFRLLRREGSNNRLHQIRRARGRRLRNPGQRDCARVYRNADDRDTYARVAQDCDRRDADASIR